MSSFKEENDKLIKEYYQTKSKESFDKLVLNNQKLVIFAMKKLNIPANLRDDYIDLGNILLIEAIKKYNPNLYTKNSFSSFIYKCIRNGFLNNFKNEKKHCVKGNVFLDAASSYREKSEDLYDIFTHPNLIIDVQEIESFIEKDEIRYKKEILLTVIHSFSEQDQDIMLSTFPLDDRKYLSQEQLSKKYNVTKAEISRRIIKCIKNLKQSLEINNNKEETELCVKKELECKLLLENYGYDSVKREKFIKALDCLKRRDKEIMVKHFGLEDNCKMEEKEIAELYDLKEESVKLIIKNCIKKISDIVNSGEENIKNKKNKKDCKKKR